MSEPLPKTWQEALPYVAWIGLVISCFLVFTTKLVERSYRAWGIAEGRNCSWAKPKVFSDFPQQIVG
jgi:hypothetical protein